MYTDEAKIRKAKVMLRNAYDNIKYGDQESLSVACHLIQMACELALKQIYVYYGKDFAQVHTIWDLVESLPDDQDILSADLIEQLEDRAETITSWKQNPKYDDRFNIRVDTINRYLNTVVLLVDSVSKAVIKDENDSISNRKFLSRLEFK